MKPGFVNKVARCFALCFALCVGLLSGCTSMPPPHVNASQDAFVPRVPMRYTWQAPQLVPDATREQVAGALAEVGLQPADAGQGADVSIALGYATREQSVGVSAACAPLGAVASGNLTQTQTQGASGSDTSSAGTCGMPGKSQPWFGDKRYLHVLTMAFTQIQDGTLRYRVSATAVDPHSDGAVALPVLLACALHPFPRAASDNDVTVVCPATR